MKPIKLLYPNDFFWNFNRCRKNCLDFHWGICGQKIWEPSLKKYSFILMPFAKFIDLKTGKIYKLKEKRPIKLMLEDSAYKAEQPDQAYVVENQNNKKNGIWCSSMDFFLPESLLKELEKVDRCPLIHFIKMNNSKLKELNPKIPSCKEIDQMLKDKPCYQVRSIITKNLE